MSSRKNKLCMVAVALAMVLTLASGIVGCAEEEGLAGTLTIYHAGSLIEPFEQLEDLYEADNPNVDILRESGGSNLMINTAITEQKAGEDPPDILASADYELIPTLMYEDGYAEWTIIYVRNTMVLCYRDGAPFADEIEAGSRTWYDVLKNEDVKWGHSDPDLDPCGYRTLMVFQLAEQYYYAQAETFGLTPDEDANGLYDACIPGNDQERGRTNQGNEVVRAKSVDLVSLLESGDLDYAFEYKSVAVQKELDYIELEEAINLGQMGEISDSGTTYQDFYAQASVELKKGSEYATYTGATILYGITILKEAPNADLAVDFIKFLLSKEGQDVMEDNGQPVVDPPKCDNPDKLPSALKKLVKQL
ncbi:MAG: tungstate ABC transporter substrate-binding protein WtpA [Dehalococcoidia bacterium]|nr:tungstate ABC transporter substrate-binding protein WtpA [Dehalococcoidia bacterium]